MRLDCLDETADIERARARQQRRLEHIQYLLLTRQRYSCAWPVQIEIESGWSMSFAFGFVSVYVFVVFALVVLALLRLWLRLLLLVTLAAPVVNSQIHISSAC